jgi:hypothetical protein
MIYFVHPFTIVLWVFLSWVIAMFGRDKRFGFFGNFLVSFLFSPLVGLIVLMASDDRYRPSMARRKF